MSGKHCPNCGACKECGHAPQPFRFNPHPYFVPYWPTVTPSPYYYGTGDFPQYAGDGTSLGTTTWTFNHTDAH